MSGRPISVSLLDPFFFPPKNRGSEKSRMLVHVAERKKKEETEGKKRGKKIDNGLITTARSMALIIFNRKNAMEDWLSGWIRDNVNTYTLLWNTWKGWSSEKKERSIFEKRVFERVFLHRTYPRSACFFPRVKVELIQLTRFTTVRALVTSFLFFINFFNYFGNANMVPLSVMVMMKYSSLNKMKNSFVWVLSF